MDNEPIRAGGNDLNDETKTVPKEQELNLVLNSLFKKVDGLASHLQSVNWNVNTLFKSTDLQEETTGFLMMQNAVLLEIVKDKLGVTDIELKEYTSKLTKNHNINNNNLWDTTSNTPDENLKVN